MNRLSNEDPRLISLCRMGQGERCCRWLARGRAGYFCAKLDVEIARWIQARFDSGEMGACGDNCPGLAP